MQLTNKAESLMETPDMGVEKQCFEESWKFSDNEKICKEN